MQGLKEFERGLSGVPDIYRTDACKHVQDHRSRSVDFFFSLNLLITVQETVKVTGKQNGFHKQCSQIIAELYVGIIVRKTERQLFVCGLKMRCVSWSPSVVNKGT